MTSKEVRNAFLEYFRQRGHEIIPSSPLIPRYDPTLLFTNAGMVQFKTIFLGEEKSLYSRVVSCQKCLRAGGKHSDLENVGHTARHHTFFEMLGNFSFGDYFKKDAIFYAWELLTEWFKLPEERLYVSVYEEDDEAVRLWSELIGLPDERIVRLGAKDNFWQMGDTGPCGPCSEIIIDQGNHTGCGRPDCAVGCECDRFLELWNLVFMQFNRDGSGVLTPLPEPSIDTGMGLERISAVLQGKTNNFDSDLFEPIISSIVSYSKIAYGKSKDTDTAIRVIADHIRSIAFLLSEGLMPSNEGRGYVLRRIIRRASRYAKLIGIDKPVLYKLLDPVVDSIGDVYPELLDEKERAEKILKLEEERFSRTLEQGIRLLDEVVESLRNSGRTLIPGDELFRLYDTYGFPLDLARDIAADNGLEIDEAGFHRELEFQRIKARASWVGEEEAVASIYREALNKSGSTGFLGYETLESESTVIAIVKDGAYLDEVKENEEAEIILDKTPFYAKSGGQVGDKGELKAEGIRATIINTKKPIEGLHVHAIKVRKGILTLGTKIKCFVDHSLRMATMRNHTATHLLHASLRAVLGDHVKQSGSFVTPERLRFDFTHFSPLDRKEIESIEDIVNEKILENIRVETSIMNIRDAIASGATALFGERYGDKVRVVKISNFSSELCGGTHVNATGDIGPFKILSEGSIASSIRRIEAVTGRVALEHFRNEEYELKKIAEMLKVSERPSQKLERFLNEMWGLEKEVEKLKGRAASDSSSLIIENVRAIEGIKVVAHRVDGLEQKDLRLLADNIRDKIGSGILILASAKDGQASFVAMVTKDLINRFNAGAILKKVAAAAGGRGGGKPEMAQGGTKEIKKLDSALESIYDIVRKTVNSEK
ncbi:MAG: alanine--tRNA ligase [Nitrospirae bacterium]|nr:alanine--tRNA ligase [Nitrospirota bacterium]